MSILSLSGEKFNPFWSFLIHFDLFWSIFIHFDPIWSILDRSEPIWIKYRMPTSLIINVNFLSFSEMHVRRNGQGSSENGQPQGPPGPATLQTPKSARLPAITSRQFNHGTCSSSFGYLAWFKQPRLFSSKELHYHVPIQIFFSQKKVNKFLTYNLKSLIWIAIRSSNQFPQKIFFAMKITKL